MRLTVPIAALLLALYAMIPVAGQADSSEAPGARPAAASGGGGAGGGGSFGEIFFISRNANPVTGENPVEWIGSGIIWLILLLSVLSIGLMGHLALANQRKHILPPLVVAEVRRQIASGKYREAMDLTGRDPSYFGAILSAALAEANQGFSSVIRALEQASQEQTTMRLRRIEYLNVLAQVSPMLGLFGTVYGMILAFRAIVIAGGNADPVLLAGGIGTALVTTFWGLIVAIPALAAYAIIRNRVDELTTEATRTAAQLLNQFRPKPKSRPAEPKPAAAPTATP